MTAYSQAKAVKLIFSGDDFFRTLEHSIDAAKEVIHFQTYIFEQDKIGNRIADSLIRAANRGVDVFLLVDAYGSKGLSIDFIKKIQAGGINFRFFSPLFSKESIYMGRRLHHKVVVVDRFAAIVGGINVGDRYHGSDKEPAWLDYAALIEGDLCSGLSDLCSVIYEKDRSRKNNDQQENEPDNQKDEEGVCLVRFTRNDWVRRRSEIDKSAFRAILTAKISIVIISSYFLPGYSYRRALKRARKRGVSVKVVVAGKSDMPFLLYAEKHMYGFFARKGIEIYEWNDSVLHGKAMMADNEWVSIGSYNLNYLSRYWSIELNAEIKDKDLAKAFDAHLNEIVSGTCTKIDSKVIKELGFFPRFRNMLAYYIYRSVMKIFFSRKYREK